MNLLTCRVMRPSAVAELFVKLITK